MWHQFCHHWVNIGSAWSNMLWYVRKFWLEHLWEKKIYFFTVAHLLHIISHAFSPAIDDQYWYWSVTLATADLPLPKAALLLKCMVLNRTKSMKGHYWCSVPTTTVEGISLNTKNAENLLTSSIFWLEWRRVHYSSGPDDETVLS